MEDCARKCRICLSIEDSKELMSIYEKNDIALKIFLCTQIKIVEFSTDGFPALICKSCLDELKIATNFRCKALKSEEFMRKQLKSNNVDITNYFNEKNNIKLETDRQVKSEPNEETFELIDNIETILGNHYSSFENVNIRSYEDTQNLHKNSLSTAARRTNPKKRSIDLDDQIIQDSKSLIPQNPIRTTNEKLYECQYCIKSFKHETYLRRHITRVHAEQTASSAKVKSKRNLKIDHEKKSYLIKHDDNSLYCEICRQFFTTRGSLQKHMKVKHEYVDVKNRYVCDYCGDHFVIKYYLIRHIRVRHLKTHVEKRSIDSPFPCEVCGKILRNRGLLKPHMRSHQIMTPNDYWYCDLCPRKFKTRGGCTWHIQQRHVLKATFKCPYDNCPVVYKGKWELKCHIKSKHTNQRDFRCEICGKGFLDKQKLQIHTRIHTGERPHACHLCSATFIHQTDLRRHIWGHTGERPIRCEVPNCGKGFMKKSELLNHTNRCHAPPAINFNTQYAL